MLGLCDNPRGEKWHVRQQADNVHFLQRGVIYSEWSPWSDTIVRTWLIPPQTASSANHIRIHRISSPRTIWTAEGAFAVRNQQGSTDISLRNLPVNLDMASVGHDAVFAMPATALASCSRQGVSGIRDVRLLATATTTRDGLIVQAEANTNLMCPRTVIPTLTGRHEGGTDTWYASAVFAMPASSALFHNWQYDFDAIPDIDWVQPLLV